MSLHGPRHRLSKHVCMAFQTSTLTAMTVWAGGNRVQRPCIGACPPRMGLRYAAMLVAALRCASETWLCSHQHLAHVEREQASWFQDGFACCSHRRHTAHTVASVHQICLSRCNFLGSFVARQSHTHCPQIEKLMSRCQHSPADSAVIQSTETDSRLRQRMEAVSRN